MAMVGNDLGDAIVTAIQAVPTPSPNDGGTAALQAYWRAIAGVVVSYLQAHADVTPTGHASLLQNPSGQAVTVNTGTGIGSTTAPATITGTGGLL